MIFLWRYFGTLAKIDHFYAIFKHFRAAFPAIIRFLTIFDQF